MPVDDAFVIKGRGVVFIGTITRGRIHSNDKVRVILENDREETATVIGIEFMKKIVDYAEKGDQVGLLVRGLTRL